MDNLVKKEAIRILQIKRTKMNRHKLLKWRKKFKHMIKARIERKENSEKIRLDRSLEGKKTMEGVWFDGASFISR